MAVLLGAALAACGPAPLHRSTRPVLELEAGANESPSLAGQPRVWDGELRPALDLRPGAAALAAIRPHPAGDSFELSVGILPGSGTGGERATLWMEFDTPQGPVERRFDLEGAGRWHAVLLPLTGRLTGARHVRLLTTGPAGAALTVSEPWLGQRADSAPAVLLVSVRGGLGASRGALEERFARGLRFEGRAVAPDGAAIERLAQAFRASGYRTFGLRCPAHAPAPAGFDRVEGPTGDPEAERAAERLARGVEQAEGQALFVWIELCAEHPAPVLEGLAGRCLADPRLRRGVRAAALQGEATLWLDWPNAPSAVVSAEPAGAVDLLHTLLALGGVDPRAIVGADLTRPWRAPACGCGACAATGRP